MAEAKKVALVGWNPDSKAIDYSKWPDLNPEKIRAALEADRDNLISLGYDAELVYIETPETAYDDVVLALQNKAYDCVMVGAGVRCADEHFLVFEKLVNAAHQYAPQARIAFNTNPKDTADAVKRWV